MARKKSNGFKQVGFRTPAARHDLLKKAAEFRGVDVSALVNALLAEAEPRLQAELAPDLLVACKAALAVLQTLASTHGDETASCTALVVKAAITRAESVSGS